MTEMLEGAAVPEESEVSAVELMTAVGEEKFTIAGITLLTGAVGLAIALMSTPIYTARTTLLPPQQAQSAMGGMAASLGALAATAGVGAALRSSEDLYVGLLKTDAVANVLIDRFKLADRYEQKTRVDTRQALADKVRVASDRKSTLIAVEVDDKDPAFAAQLANAHAETLRELMGRIAVTEAQQRRAFFEQQMAKAKDELVKAEMAAKQAQDKGGLLSVDSQTQTLIGAAAQIRGQVVAREVQIQAMRPYAGPENPDLRRLMTELGSLRAQLSKLEGGSGASGAARSDKADNADNRDALGNVRLFRELKYQEAIYTAMLQQFQLARADEARDAPLLQQVDVALPPDRKSKPKRSSIVLGALFAGLLLGLVVAFVRRAARAQKQSPETAGQWQALVDAWSLRGKVSGKGS